MMRLPSCSAETVISWRETSRACSVSPSVMIRSASRSPASMVAGEFVLELFEHGDHLGPVHFAGPGHGHGLGLLHVGDDLFDPVERTHRFAPVDVSHGDIVPDEGVKRG
jgi:hypothetical protein